jgi:hypothetical protein
MTPMDLATEHGRGSVAPVHPLLARFLDGVPPCAPFTHRDHVEVAWRLLEAMPLERAIGVFCDRLRRIATIAGAPQKFHATLTWCYLVLVDARRAQAQSWDAFARGNAELFDRTHPAVAQHYSPERLATDEARRTFVFPDRLPL